MSRTIKFLVGGAGFAALAAAAPAASQYYNYGYGYNGYAVNTSVAASQCTAAVNNRLYTRRGLGGIIGSLLGAYATTPRVLSVTRVMPTGYGGARVRGLASTGRYAYGYGYNQADLSFRCDVDPSGYVRGVSINRRY